VTVDERHFSWRIMIITGQATERENQPGTPQFERQLHAITPLRPGIVASPLGEDVILFGAIVTSLEVAREIVFQQSASLP
jgi:hypothetical protein